MNQFFVIRLPKYWSFSFSISPSNEYSGLISFRMDLLDLHAVQGTLKSLFQHHSSKASILWHSAFFIVWLSCPYATTGKTIALTRHTFVGKVMSLLCSMLSRLVTAFLPRSKCLFFYIYITVFEFYFIFKLYITVLVLPNIKMNPPQVHTCSPSRTPLPPPSPFHPSGSSQCTSTSISIIDR